MSYASLSVWTALNYGKQTVQAEFYNSKFDTYIIICSVELVSFSTGYFLLIFSYYLEHLRKYLKYMYGNYCKPLYFRMYFISRFCDLRLFRGNLNSRCMMFSYLNFKYANILWECWIREGSNSRILAKIKFSRIKVNLQYMSVFNSKKTLTESSWC